MPLVLPEIRSDLAVFHGEREPWALPGPRFLELVTSLPFYEGAVRGALRMLFARQLSAQSQASPPAAPTPGGGLDPATFGPAAAIIPPGAQVTRLNDARAAAALTQNDLGAPSVTYKGG